MRKDVSCARPTARRNNHFQYKLLRASMASALAIALVALPGCKSSLTLTEILFDQDSSTVDQTNASRFLRNILDSLNMTEELAQLLEKKTDLHREDVSDEAVKGKDKSKDKVADTNFDKTAPSNSDAGESGSGKDAASSSSAGKKKGNSSSGSKGSNKKKKKGSGSDDSNSKGSGSSKGGSSGDGSDEPENNTPIYHGKGGTGKTYGDDGAYEELPEGVQTVVAFGECANMVVSFAGEHALSGADSDFISNSFIKTAYKSKDIANVKKVKVTKGVVDASKVVELAPDALLLSGTEQTVSKSDLAKLKEAKIDVIYLPSMNSATHIKEVATSIGKMFGSTTLSGDNAKKAAEKYVEWHDGVVKDMTDANGGIVGNRNFDTGGDNDGPVGKYTMYIDKWDDATYYASPDNALAWTDTNGVAITKAGYKWSPMSYYLSAGGTQNVSATFKSSFYEVSALYYVWQFNLGRVPTVYSKNWSDVSITTAKLSNSGTDDLITRVSNSVSLGSDKYKYVITGSKSVTSKMKKSISASKKSGAGLYATYPSIKGKDGSGTGFLSAKGAYCSSAIAGSFDVYTNPSGLYSSWIGGSPESVLETAWISDVNNGTERVSTYIKQYYKMFYGVELSSSQLSTILAGKGE